MCPFAARLWGFLRRSANFGFTDSFQSKPRGRRDVACVALRRPKGVKRQGVSHLLGRGEIAVMSRTVRLF